MSETLNINPFDAGAPSAWESLQAVPFAASAPESTPVKSEASAELTSAPAAELTSDPTALAPESAPRSEAEIYAERRADPANRAMLTTPLALIKGDLEDAATRIPASGAIDNTTLRKMEKYYAMDYASLQSAYAFLGYSGQNGYLTPEQRVFQADAEADLYRSENGISHSLEALSGRFYTERVGALREAIRANARPTADRDLKSIRELEEASDLHHYYEELDQNGGEYGVVQDRARVSAHNKALGAFNRVNRLCESYGVDRLIPRNLWFSDSRPENVNVRNRLSYDRHLFDAYCASAGI